MLLQKLSSINNLKTPVFNIFVLSSNQLQLFVTIDIHNANIQVTIIYVFYFNVRIAPYILYSSILISIPYILMHYFSHINDI